MQKNLTKNAHLIDKDDREQEVVDFCNLFPLQLCVSNCQNITMSSHSSYLQKQVKGWVQKEPLLLCVQNGRNYA